MLEVIKNRGLIRTYIDKEIEEENKFIDKFNKINLNNGYQYE